MRALLVLTLISACTAEPSHRIDSHDPNEMALERLGGVVVASAVQCEEQVELPARQGEAVHPRAGDTAYPDFFLQRCTQCKRCTEECPFGTLNEDKKGTPEFNPLRCRRCGICMGACPERIVSFPDYSVQQIAEMIKVIEVPEDYEEKPRIVALLCENDALPALDKAAAAQTTLEGDRDAQEAARQNMMWLGRSNYQLDFPPDSVLSERVIFPVTENESRGIEDARFVRGCLGAAASRQASYGGATARTWRGPPAVAARRRPRHKETPEPSRAARVRKSS